jgi:integrase/recombinase XerC
MNTTLPLDPPSPHEPTDDPVAPSLTAYTEYLSKRRYSASTVRHHPRRVAHFATWAARCRLHSADCDERAVQRFLDEHPPGCRCSCPGPRPVRGLKAALSCLLIVWRTQGALAEAPTGTTPVDEALRRFNYHLERVRGLAPKTIGIWPLCPRP